MAADLDRAYVINGDDLRIALLELAGKAITPGDAARNILSEHAQPLVEERDITRERLADALQSFYLDVNCQGAVKHGHVVNANEVAAVLIAQLSANRAHEDADICDHLPVDPEVAAMAALAPALAALKRLKHDEAMRVMRWATDRATDSLPPF
jgi:hypothetical protein